MQFQLLLVIAAGVLAVIYGAVQTSALLRQSPGNARMQEIAAAIQEGAQAYLRRQYTTIAIVGVVVLVLLAIFFKDWHEPVGFLIGACLSGLAGFAGTAGPVKQGSGGLIWPVNGPITSPFCESRAWEACHPGIDIGVPAGTPIRAAAAGKVVLLQPAAASGGYGNFTCIQHTASLSTCYAHQSRFNTFGGATVSQGQVIGFVGCTGRCFGPHLHFETRVNGHVVNPMNYL